MEIVNETIAIGNVPRAIGMSDGDIKTQLGCARFPEILTVLK